MGGDSVRDVWGDERVGKGTYPDFFLLFYNILIMGPLSISIEDPVQFKSPALAIPVASTGLCV